MAAGVKRKEDGSRGGAEGAEKAPEHIVRDLSNKCADDVEAAVFRTALLVAAPSDRFWIALAGTAGALGISAAALEKWMGRSSEAEDLADALWDKLRPMLLDTVRRHQQPAPSASSAPPREPRTPVARC